MNLLSRRPFAILGTVASALAITVGVAMTVGGGSAASSAPVGARPAVAAPVAPVASGGLAGTVSAAPRAVPPRIVVKRVPVPGPTVVRTVPGPTRVVTVPGPARVVVRTVPAPVRCVVFRFPTINPDGSAGRPDSEMFCSGHSSKYTGAIVVNGAGSVAG